MELEERVRSLKERLAVLNARLRPTDESKSNKAKAEVSGQENTQDSRSSRLRSSLTQSKKAK